MRNDCLARRACANSATPATSFVAGDKRSKDVKPTVLLDKDATAAPVATTVFSAARHGLVVGDVNLAVLTSINCCLRTAVVTASNTQAAAFAVNRFVARNRATCHGKRNRFAPEASVDSATSLVGVVGRNRTARHVQCATIDRSNTAAAEQTKVELFSDIGVDAVVGNICRINDFNISIFGKDAAAIAIIGIVDVVIALLIRSVARDNTA